MMLLGRYRAILSVLVFALGALFGGAGGVLLGLCGPFTDVSDPNFCPFILEIFYLGITSGTTATTFDPTSNVTRIQMAAFLSRTVDATLKHGSRRAALKQFWTTQNDKVLRLTAVGNLPQSVGSDGADLWVANYNSGSISRVRGSDGRLLETWTDATEAAEVVVAAGYIFATGQSDPQGKLYRIDPSQAAGAVTTVASNLGQRSTGVAFDGFRIWTANYFDSSVSIVTPGAILPWTVTTVTAGFDTPIGALYDGANIWVTSFNALQKLDNAGDVLQTVTTGAGGSSPTFDGTSIWVPNTVANSVSVVRVSNGAVLATLTGNGLDGPRSAAFDGQRILAANSNGNSVSLWKAADLTPLGSFSTGASTSPFGSCSDGVSFWITLYDSGKLARF